MTAPGPIVVGYDGSPGCRRAARWAFEHADGRRIVAVAALGGEPGVLPLPALPGQLTRRAETVAHAWGRDTALFGAEAEILLRRGHPAEVLREVADELGASLIVVGHRRLRAAELRGSVSRHVASGSHVPVTVID